MVPATKSRETETLNTLLVNVRMHLTGSSKEFTDASKALVDYLSSSRIISIFNQTPFIEKFCRTDLVELAKDADNAGKNFWPHLAKISKAYHIVN